MQSFAKYGNLPGMRSLVFGLAITLAASAKAADLPTYFPASLAKSTVSCKFGSGESKPIDILSDFENRWFSQEFAAAGEPSLDPESAHLQDGDGKTLRFTWLRSFHAPVFVRIVGLGTRNPRLVAKELSGKGGYAPGVISRHLERPLSSTEADAIERTLSRTKVLSEPAKLCDISVDGAQWIIEVADAGGYHFVERTSPDKGAVRDLGIELLRLTKWKLNPIY